MEAYFTPIIFAIFTFPIIAFLITLPYMIFEYHKYGSIPFLRTCIIYSFILYLITIYFLVILPLPSLEEVSKLTTPIMQLIPFQAIVDLINNTSFVISNPNTYLIALKESYFYVIAFNIVMFIPLGIYLRYYFRWKPWQIILCGLLISLFFEFTQLSGLYGIYPRPYRLFDIDDLIMNTIGVSIGCLISPIVSKILPSKQRIDKVTYARSKNVSFTRRLLALFLDWTILITVAILITIFIPKWNWNLKYILLIISYYMILPMLTKGRTLGKIIVHIRIVNKEEKNANFLQYMIRYGILYLLWLPAPFTIFQLLQYMQGSIATIFIILDLCFVIGILWIIFNVQLLLTMITQKNYMFYEKWSHTKNISTLKIKENEPIIIEENNESI